MITTKPLVSVLMTAYNREQYIGEAIESVLASTYENFELIIVDDHSADNTVSVAKKYAAANPKVKVYVNETNLGDYQNRNKAAAYANGKYLKYWDSDDVLYPHALSVMIDCMEKFPDAGFGLVKAHMPLFDQPYPLQLDHPFKVFCTERSLLSNSPGSAIIKKELFDKVNGFSGKRYIGDNELWINCSFYSPLVIIPGFLGWDRTHAVQERNFDPVKYEELRQGLFFAALENPLNQLTETEKKSIRKKAKSSIIKNALNDFLKLRWAFFLKKHILIKYLFK
jgi:glycosyltransferase involved in cell wall biosynthesis